MWAVQEILCYPQRAGFHLHLTKPVSYEELKLSLMTLRSSAQPAEDLPAA